MNRQQLLLVQLMEEAAEVAKECQEVIVRASKALRFGLEEVQEDQNLTNKRRLTEKFALMLCESAEMAAVLTMLDLDVPEGTQQKVDDAYEHKEQRVEKHLELSRRCGVLKD